VNRNLRFVVLHHTNIAQPHFDLMLEFESNSPLATWRCQHWPPHASEVFTPLGDHRRDYLDYQGPVSNNRGNVSRVGSGKIISLQADGQIWQVELPGGVKLKLPR
jgi:hypothetical protein